MERVMQESVTINVKWPPVVKPMINEGEFVRLSNFKRHGLYVTKTIISADEETYTMKPAYKPSPKSVLKNGRSPFSKMKCKIFK